MLGHQAIRFTPATDRICRVCERVSDVTRRDSRPDSVTAMTNDVSSEPKTLPIKTLLVGMDLGHTYRVFNEYRPFGHGERIPVDPPGTVAIVRGSRTVETERR